jgi:hypothetical protein|tara:strand:- start:427 stop:606 length:180 start_codon:yes stop_codon:yes gene_type:complete
MNILNKNNSVSNAFIAGTLISIVGSVVIWTTGTDAQQLAIFVGLWAPTFMGFANYYEER